MPRAKSQPDSVDSLKREVFQGLQQANIALRLLAKLTGDYGIQRYAEFDVADLRNEINRYLAGFSNETVGHRVLGAPVAERTFRDVEDIMAAAFASEEQPQSE